MWKQLRELLKHSAIYGLGNLAVSILSLLLIPLYTHYLSTAEFGQYSILIVIYGLLSLVADCGTSNSIARYYFDDKPATESHTIAAGHHRLLSTGMAVATLTAGTVAAASLVFSTALSSLLFRTPDYAGHIQLVGLAVMFYGLAAAPMIYLRISERPVAFTVITSLQVALFLLLNIVCVVVLRLGTKGILFSLMLSTAAYSAAAIVTVRKSFRLDLDRAVAWELVRFGLPFLPVLLLKWVIDFSDRYLLDHYSNVSEVGIYSLGYKFGQVMTFVVGAFTMGWVPIRFKLLALEDPKVAFGRVATFYLAGAGFVWLGLAICSVEIIHLTSTAQYYRGAAYIAPVALGYLFYGLFVLAVTGQGVAKRNASLPLVSLVAAIVNVGFNLVMIPRIGPMGAAYATLISYALMVLGSLYFSQRLYKISYEYAKCGILLAGMVCLAWIGRSLQGLPIVLGLLSKALILLAFCLLVLACRVLTRAEMSRLIRMGSQVLPPSMRIAVSARLSPVEQPEVLKV